MLQPNKLMNALRLFFCVVFPPLAVLLTGRMGSFVLSLVLTLFFWLPGALHAFVVVLDYNADMRTKALSR